MGTRSIVRSLTLALAFVVWFTPALRAQDLPAYRGFRLGMTVPAVATQAGLPATAAKVVFEHPLLIQELEWRPPVIASATGAPAEPDSVAQVLFDFCDGGLYRIVVSYDSNRTEGMTEQDLIEVLSAAYGPAHMPIARIIVAAASENYNDTESVTARWEDERSSVNLFQATGRSAFGLVIFSKKVAPLARAGIDEGKRLAELDAPRRQVAEQKARDEVERATHATVRIANKAAFRY